VDIELLERVRDTLPPALNAGILAGDGGYCILGWMLSCSGMHGIALYNNTISVADPTDGGAAVDVVARRFGLTPAIVQELAELNDATDATNRSAVVRAKLDAILASAESSAGKHS